MSDGKYEELNSAQREAVMSEHSRILCLAGAGCGKTKTMVTRAARLIESGVDPENILMLTFTNAAAQEQKERLIRLVGEPAAKVWASTFHSWAVREIRNYGLSLGYTPAFSIYDQEDTASIVEAIITDLQIKTKAKDVIEAMTKNNVYGVPIPVGPIKMVVDEYRFKCRQQNAIDLDSLISTLQTLMNKDTIHRIMQTKYKYVFVDEFQDTDHRQMKLLNTLDPENLFVVGDDFQSIYGFRGSDVEIIMNLAENEDWQTIKLEENYRSTRQIVDAANRLIKHNNQTEKELKAHRNGPEIEQLLWEFPEDELTGVGKMIPTFPGQYRDTAILARTNKQVNAMAEVLEKLHIPYDLRHTVSDALRTIEAKRLFQWMSLANNPQDNEAAYAIVNWPLQTITKRDLLEVEMFQLEKECSLITALEYKEKALPFLEKLHTIQSQRYISAAVEVFDLIVDTINILTINANKGLQNRNLKIAEIRNAMVEWTNERTKTGSDIGVDAWLEFYKMRMIEGTDLEEEEKKDAVQLMTAHGSKGLEFKNVVVIGCNDKQFPLSRGDIEEERRLFYVAMTRAKDQLMLSRSLMKESWGSTMEDAEPSVFLNDMQ